MFNGFCQMHFSGLGKRIARFPETNGFFCYFQLFAWAKQFSMNGRIHDAIICSRFVEMYNVRHACLPIVNVLNTAHVKHILLFRLATQDLLPLIVIDHDMKPLMI